METPYSAGDSGQEPVLQQEACPVQVGAAPLHVPGPPVSPAQVRPQASPASGPAGLAQDAAAPAPVLQQDLSGTPLQPEGSAAPVPTPDTVPSTTAWQPQSMWDGDVWWEQDTREPTLWWKWSEERGWQRWQDRTDADTKPVTGWMGKCLALVHMHGAGDTQRLHQALSRLSEHPSLESGLHKLSGQIAKKGKDQVYKKYIS